MHPSSPLVWGSHQNSSMYSGIRFSPVLYSPAYWSPLRLSFHIILCLCNFLSLITTLIITFCLVGVRSVSHVCDSECAPQGVLLVQSHLTLMTPALWFPSFITRPIYNTVTREHLCTYLASLIGL